MRDLPTIPVSRVRLAGQAPRIAVMGVCGVLTFGGAIRTFMPAPAANPEASVVRSTDLTQERGLAERFAFEYLTQTPGADDERERRLRSLGLADTAALADRVGSQRARVTAASVADATPVAGGADITVAVAIDDAWLYLLVPVRRGRDGLSVAGPPAVVGPPRVVQDALGRPEDEVQDAALKRVVERVVRHYVAGDRTDLAADLASGASVSPPRTDLRVAAVQAVTWAAPPARVAVAVRVRGRRGLTLTLRYELSVVRRAGRWLVTAVAANPNHQEQRR